MNQVKAYRQGREAHNAGKDSLSNPYGNVSQEDQDWHADWADGWNDACEAALEDSAESDGGP